LSVHQESHGAIGPGLNSHCSQSGSSFEYVEEKLFWRLRFLSGVRRCVIPNSFARKLPPLGCLERLIFQGIHLVDVTESR